MSKASDDLKQATEHFFRTKIGKKKNIPAVPAPRPKKKKVESEKKRQKPLADEKGTDKIEIYHTDNYYTIMKLLPLAAQSLYGYLYRESYGWNSDTCFLGYRDIIRTLQITKTTKIRHINLLKKLKYIQEIKKYNDREKQGTIYRVYTPEEIINYYKKKDMSFDDNESVLGKLNKLPANEFPDEIPLDKKRPGEEEGEGASENRKKIGEIFRRKFPDYEISDQAVTSLIDEHNQSMESLITIIKRMRKKIDSPDKYFIKAATRQRAVDKTKKKIKVKKEEAEIELQPKEGKGKAKQTIALEDQKKQDATDVAIEKLSEIDRNMLRLKAMSAIKIQNMNKDKETINNVCLSEPNVRIKMKELFLREHKWKT